MNYQEAVKELGDLVGQYSKVWESDNKEEAQDLRDQLSIALWFFGPEVARFRANAERAENARKMKYDERKKYWKHKYGGARGTASLVEADAHIDCADVIKEEEDAKENYYLAKALQERTDQVLNSISSRIKDLQKHE